MTKNFDGQVEAAVLEALLSIRPGRVLIVSTIPQTMPKLSTQNMDSQNCLIVCVSPGGNFDTNSVICEFESLPFEDGAFNVVVAHHALGEKLPADLEELQRVLSQGGQLLIIGRGMLEIKERFRRDGPVALNHYSTQRLLRRRGFRIISCEGFGIFGMRVRLNRSWQKLFIPFSDRLLIKAQHHTNNHVVTPLRFSSPQAAGVRSAALDSLNREAV